MSRCLTPRSGLDDGGIELNGTERGVESSWRVPFEPSLAGHSAPSSTPHGRPPYLLDTEADVIDRFSELVQQGAHDDLLTRLRLVLPGLTDVEVATSADGTPFLLATTDDDRRLPLQALGGGMRRLFRLFVGFRERQGGIVLADEIENGLHHHVLPELWRQLRVLVREFDVQLFAATHSDECLLAAMDAFGDDPEQIAVHGLYRPPGGAGVRAVTYADGTLQGARDLDLELR